MSDFLSDKQNEIKKRIAELQPQVEEHARLEAALEALGGLPASSNNAVRGSGQEAAPTAKAPRRRGPGRPRGSRAAPSASTSRSARAARPAATRRPGRKRGSGKRGQQALSLIAEQPGIAIADMAVKMGIKTSYLYRVVPELEKEGKVRKEGKGWHIA